jgi:hypothetical protein
VSKKAWRKPIHHQEVGRVANELKAKRSTKRLLIFYFSPEMMAYKNYCNRRTAKKKGQDPEESHCCPLRMPIIGPILFSLFIFSPFILPTSDREKNLELVSDSTVEEPRLTKDDSLPILEIPDNDQHSSLP